MDLFQSVLDAFYVFIAWLWEIIAGLAATLVSPLLDWFPNVTPVLNDGLAAWMSLMTYLEVANAWIPLDAGFVLLNLYAAFMLQFLVVKLVLKLAPFIG
jgi:hypothetical protein